MGTADRFKLLLTRYLNGTLTAAQQREFFDLTASGLYDDVLNSSFDDDAQSSEHTLTDGLNPSASAEILENILKAGKPDHRPDKENSGNKNRFFFFAAAAVLILTFAVFLHFYYAPQKGNHLAVDLATANPVKQINNGRHPVALTMADGSRIILQPGSSLFYQAASFKTRRGIYLNGEAVFYVVKDPAHPFYVFHNNVVTRVLGTSFKIKTNAGGGNLEVEVYTGKVKVYEGHRAGGAVARRAVIVTPNYKILYRPVSHAFQTLLAANPQPIADNENIKMGLSAAPVNFMYTNTKVAAVLKDLETGYGIKITVNNSDIENCVFTGNITKESLFNKLKVLCLAINAQYEVNGSSIIIKGGGCN